MVHQSEDVVDPASDGRNLYLCGIGIFLKFCADEHRLQFRIRILVVVLVFFVAVVAVVVVFINFPPLDPYWFLYS